MEAICYSETSVDFQLTTWGYILKDSTPYLLVFISSNIHIEFKKTNAQTMIKIWKANNDFSLTAFFPLFY
jgi:hypothetical protein